MNDKPAGPSLRRPLLVLLAALIVVPTVLLATNAFGLRDYLGIARRIGMFDSGGGGARVQMTVSGTVTDHQGRAARDASVRIELELTSDNGAAASLSNTAKTDEDGRYATDMWYDSDVLHRARRVDVSATLQAFGPGNGTEPSATVRLDLSPVGEASRDLQLGEPLPTVELGVTDSTGAAVAHYWATVIPVGDVDDVPHLPWIEVTAANGVGLLPVPKRPFRVDVHLERGARKTVVGPFDREDLPDRIDVTLADR